MTATTRATTPLLLGLAFLPSPGAHAQRDFIGGEVLPLVSRGDSLALEDLTGDGLADIIVGHSHRGEASILLARAGGGYQAPAVLRVGMSPVMILAHGDFNSDARPDLFVVNSGSASVSVLLNQGAGAWGEPLAHGVGPNPRTAGLADFNLDGALDAVTSDLVAVDFGQITVLLGNGQGGFREGAPITIGDNAHSSVVEDFDGDGRLDVGVAHTQTISVFRSRGDGTFHPVDAVPLDQINPRVLTSGELTGDGRPDMAAYLDHGSLLVLVNEGGARFEKRIFPPEARPVGPVIKAVDFDLDGIGDVIANVGRGNGEVGLRVLRGRPAADFPTLVHLFPAIHFASGACRDLDADGDIDAVLGRSDAAELAIFAGLPAARLEVPISASVPALPRGLVSFARSADGAPGLAAIGSSSIQLLALAPGGELVQASPLELPGRALQAGAVADLDGDGGADLALADLAAGAAVVLLDPAGPAPRHVERSAGPTPRGVEAGDFDGDGELDLAVIDQANPAVTLLLRPLAQPPPAPIAVDAGAGQTALAAADLDGDGFLDLAVAARTGVAVLVGDGKGVLTLRRRIEAVNSAVAVEAISGAGGGAGDLVMAAGRRLVVARDVAGAGDPAGVEFELGVDARALDFAPLEGGSDLRIVIAGRDRVLAAGVSGNAVSAFDAFPLGALLRGVVLADLDADGLLDCAAGDFGTSVVAVLRGQARQGAGFRRGDADGDGRTVLTDAIVILERLFAGRAPLGCPDAGDADDNGSLALTDAVVLLAYLFQGAAPPAPPGPEVCGEDGTADALERCEAPCG